MFTGLWEGDHLEDAFLEGRIILKLIFKQLDEDMDWIDLAQGRELMNVVMNLRVPENEVNFLNIRRLISFSERTVLNGVSLVRYLVIKD